MFVTKKKYDDLYRIYQSTLYQLEEMTEMIFDYDEYIEELEAKLTEATAKKKKVAKKATKKVSK